MNNDLIQRILVQLEPSLAQEFIVEIEKYEKKSRAFELLMKRYGFRVYEIKDFEGNEHKHLTTGLRDGYYTL